jgi:hypothetical protein
MMKSSFTTTFQFIVILSYDLMTHMTKGAG